MTEIEHEHEWVSLIQGGTEAIRNTARLLESRGITPRITAVPGGCGTKLILAVAKEDAPDAVALLQKEAAQEWESTTDTSGGNAAEGVCPACGTAATTSEETCSDCGLRLR